MWLVAVTPDRATVLFDLDKEGVLFERCRIKHERGDHLFIAGAAHQAWLRPAICPILGRTMIHAYTVKTRMGQMTTLAGVAAL